LINLLEVLNSQLFLIRFKRQKWNLTVKLFYFNFIIFEVSDNLQLKKTSLVISYMILLRGKSIRRKNHFLCVWILTVGPRGYPDGLKWWELIFLIPNFLSVNKNKARKNIILRFINKEERLNWTSFSLDPSCHFPFNHMFFYSTLHFWKWEPLFQSIVFFKGITMIAKQNPSVINGEPTLLVHCLY